MGDYVDRRKSTIFALLPQPVGRTRECVRSGGGVFNTIIDNLPVPLHLPGMKYAGPGTLLDLQLKQGVKPANKLDEAAMHHDIAYANSKDTAARSKADYALQNRAWERVVSHDAGLGERANAWLVTNSMKFKRWLGQGLSGKNYKRKVGSSVGTSLSSYTEVNVNLSDEDRERLNQAVLAKKPVEITVHYPRTKEAIANEMVLPLTKSQAGSLRKAAATRRSAKLKLSKKQTTLLAKKGGFLPALVPLLASVIPAALKAFADKQANNRLIEERERQRRALEAPTSLTSRGSGLRKRKTTSSKGKGVYVNKRPAVAAGAPRGRGLYINKKPITSRRARNDSSSSAFGNGLLQELLKKKSRSVDQFRYNKVRQNFKYT